MKRILLLAQLLAVSAVGAQLETTIVERGPHHRIWQTIRTQTAPDGSTVTNISSYSELATGMHYQENGKWLESQAQIEITDRGAVANRGQHKAAFPANINSGIIELLTPDAKVFHSRVLGF